MLSVSKSDLILEINGKAKLSVVLKRHLAPATVGTILRSLPVDGNAHSLGQSIVYFKSNINSGIERARTDFKKGDVAFDPTEKSFCFFVRDVTLTKKMSPIGKITSDIKQLTNIKAGDVLSLYQDTG